MKIYFAILELIYTVLLLWESDDIRKSVLGIVIVITMLCLFSLIVLGK